MLFLNNAGTNPTRRRSFINQVFVRFMHNQKSAMTMTDHISMVNNLHGDQEVSVKQT